MTIIVKKLKRCLWVGDLGMASENMRTEKFFEGQVGI